MTSADSDAWHVPVLAQEALEALLVDPKGLYVDLTAGGGGHSSLILERLETGGRLLAADRDGEAIIESEKRLAAVKTKGTYQVIQATFSDFPHWLAADDRGSVKGLMADLGVSSRQFDRGERGFSYLHDGPLDMRMNMESGQSAAELLAGISQTGLAALLRLYGEERYAASIAAAIVARRRKEPITRTLELAEIVASAVPARERREGNPARKTFQAIRMAVNQEQEELAHLLDVIPPVMAQGGRLALISFHSLEDRMIKQTMRHWQNPCQCPRDFPACICGKKPLGRQWPPKPISPSGEEIQRNPRARSARMRVFEFKGDQV